MKCNSQTWSLRIQQTSQSKHHDPLECLYHLHRTENKPSNLLHIINITTKDEQLNKAQNTITLKKKLKPFRYFFVKHFNFPPHVVFLFH